MGKDGGLQRTEQTVIVARTEGGVFRRDAQPRQKSAGDDRHARAGIKQRNALRLLYADMDEQQVFKAAVRETIRHTFFFPFCYGAYACMASCSVMTAQPFSRSTPASSASAPRHGCRT